MWKRCYKCRAAARAAGQYLSHKPRVATPLAHRFEVRWGVIVFLLLVWLASQSGLGQQSTPKSGSGTVQGVVMADQKPVAAADVTIVTRGVNSTAEFTAKASSNAAGAFVFRNLPTGSYRLLAEKRGSRSSPVIITVPSSETPQRVKLVLEGSGLHGTTSSKSSSLMPVRFADEPNFTVAGITDWTAAAGHGSDSTLRASEALARETLALKRQTESAAAANPAGSEAALREAAAKDPGSFEANHRLGEFLLNEGQYRSAAPFLAKAHDIRPADSGNAYDLARAYESDGNLEPALELVNQLLAHNASGDAHRLAGEIDEKMGKPLSAVREYKQAVLLDPSEQNYFAWGSELLYHRAIWQSVQVFQRGEAAYPKSVRMLLSLGSAQFAGGLYDKAAVNFCRASDLDPADSTPYLFMGKVDEVSPDSLPCIGSRLARFAGEHPESAPANYLYAMAILKRHKSSYDPQAMQQARALLEKAVALDKGYGKAYLQLGILAYSDHHVPQAIAYYQQAIAASPQLTDSYFRLGIAYSRIGKREDARREFQLRNEIEERNNAAVNAKRQEIKQFTVVQNGAPPAPESR